MKLSVALLVVCGCSNPARLESLCSGWVDHPDDPLLVPLDGEAIIADPTVVSADEAGDGRWHLWAHALTGIHHFTSDDGVSWHRTQKGLFGIGATRPFVFRHGATWYLYFEQFTDLLVPRSHVAVATSTDLETWDAPRPVLAPELTWEGSTLGNPSIAERDGALWLYYSANTVLLPDTNYPEPRFIGAARGEDPLGPFARGAEPLLGPDEGQPQRNLGAGSLKVLDSRIEGKWVAMNNGIYRDTQGHSRSAITFLQSDDGLAWSPVCETAPLAPVAEAPWKSAFVYAFDAVRAGVELRVWYNAREGWVSPGIERIGLSTLTLGK